MVKPVKIQTFKRNTDTPIYPLTESDAVLYSPDIPENGNTDNVRTITQIVNGIKKEVTLSLVYGTKDADGNYDSRILAFNIDGATDEQIATYTLHFLRSGKVNCRRRVLAPDGEKIPIYGTKMGWVHPAHLQEINTMNRICPSGTNRYPTLSANNRVIWSEFSLEKQGEIYVPKVDDVTVDMSDILCIFVAWHMGDVTLQDFEYIAGSSRKVKAMAFGEKATQQAKNLGFVLVDADGKYVSNIVRCSAAMSMREDLALLTVRVKPN